MDAATANEAQTAFYSRIYERNSRYTGKSDRCEDRNGRNLRTVWQTLNRNEKSSLNRIFRERNCKKRTNSSRLKTIYKEDGKYRRIRKNFRKRPGEYYKKTAKISGIAKRNRGYEKGDLLGSCLSKAVVIFRNYRKYLGKGEKMLADYHVHTAFSNDSVYTMEDVVKDAISLGMEDICFTDHVDYGPYRDWDDPRGIEYRAGEEGEPEWVALTNVEYKKYFSLIEELKEKYKEQISIKAGLEFGVQTHTIPEYEKLFASYPFDFIILSIHQVGDEEFWTNEYQSMRTQQEYNEGYYKELLSVVQNYHNYSVLGHMDLIVRYDEQGPYSFEKVKPIITEILKTVIADGKGIEVNTSNHRYGIADMTPSRDILKLYRELGGTIITIGSDSHKKEHLGAYIDWAKEELRKLGYTQFCTFEKMKPVFHDLMD